MMLIPVLSSWGIPKFWNCYLLFQASFLSSCPLPWPHLLSGIHDSLLPEFLTSIVLKYMLCIMTWVLKVDFYIVHHLKVQAYTPRMASKDTPWLGSHLTIHSLLMFPSSKLISGFPRCLVSPLSHITWPAISHLQGLCLHPSPSLDWRTLYMPPFSSPPFSPWFTDWILLFEHFIEVKQPRHTSLSTSFLSLFQTKLC